MLPDGGALLMGRAVLRDGALVDVNWVTGEGTKEGIDDETTVGKNVGIVEGNNVGNAVGNSAGDLLEGAINKINTTKKQVRIYIYYRRVRTRDIYQRYLQNILRAHVWFTVGPAVESAPPVV